ACFTEIEPARGGHRALDRHLDALKAAARELCASEAGARDFACRLSCALQASLLVQHAPPATADAFCRARLDPRCAQLYGALPPDVDFRAIIARAASR
ncbi:MAG TPA: DNA alkylation response protein, partial [Rhodoblastus sp.]|nr:DNA alkylation response protein [Rhodoblastus sp.]